MDFAAARAKRRYDARHRPLEFNEGDKVYLRLHRGYHLPGRPPRKYSQQRAGPFVIKRRIGRLAYELDLPPNMGIHPVISVAHLSPTPPGNDPFDRETPPPGPVEDSQASSSENQESGEEYEVEAVLNHRKQPSGAYQYLIKWTGSNNEHNVWKTAYQLRHAAKLIERYWARRGGLPDPAPQEAPRRRGRPRKNPTPEATKSSSPRKATKNTESADSPENAEKAVSRGGRQLRRRRSTAEKPAPAEPDQPAPRRRGRPPKTPGAPAPGTPKTLGTTRPRRNVPAKDKGSD